MAMRIPVEELEFYGDSTPGFGPPFGQPLKYSNNYFKILK